MASQTIHAISDIQMRYGTAVVLQSRHRSRYFLQKSRFVGIRGGIDKPVCAITTGEASKVLEFYSLPAGETDQGVEKHRYLPLPTIEENDTIKMCRKLVRPIYYQCAALVALSLKDQSSANLFEIAKSYLI